MSYSYYTQNEIEKRKKDFIVMSAIAGALIGGELTGSSTGAIIGFLIGGGLAKLEEEKNKGRVW